MIILNQRRDRQGARHLKHNTKPCIETSKMSCNIFLMQQQTLPNPPFAYFITFTTYGTWLHGDKRGSVDPLHHQFETPRLKPNQDLYVGMKTKQRYKTIFLDKQKRKVVMKAIQSACQNYHWHLYAIHVRSNHVHMIVQATTASEKIMGQLKAYASRALNKLANQTSPQKYWSRHGSTRYIWSSRFLFPVMHYVIDQQGSRMACYYDAWYDQCNMEYDEY